MFDVIRNGVVVDNFGKINHALRRLYPMAASASIKPLGHKGRIFFNVNKGQRYLWTWWTTTPKRATISGFNWLELSDMDTEDWRL